MIKFNDRNDFVNALTTLELHNNKNLYYTKEEFKAAMMQSDKAGCFNGVINLK